MQTCHRAKLIFLNDEEPFKYRVMLGEGGRRCILKENDWFNRISSQSKKSIFNSPLNQPNSFQYIKNYHILLLFSEQVEKATRITNLTIFDTWKTKYNKTRVLFGLFLQWLFVSIFEIEIVWWRSHNAFRKKILFNIVQSGFFESELKYFFFLLNSSQ